MTTGSASFLRTASTIGSNLGQRMTSQSGVSNLLSHATRVLFSTGFFKANATLRNCLVGSSMIYVLLLLVPGWSSPVLLSPFWDTSNSLTLCGSTILWTVCGSAPLSTKSLCATALLGVMGLTSMAIEEDICFTSPASSDSWLCKVLLSWLSPGLAVSWLGRHSSLSKSVKLKNTQVRTEARKKADWLPLAEYL